MKYNFDKIYSRKKTNSLKWDLVEKLYGHKNLLPLWVADMDFQSPRPVIHALKKTARFGIYGYSVALDDYYTAIINWMQKRFNWQIKKEWIRFTPGIVPALNLLVQTFTRPGDSVIVQPPVYYPFMTAVINNQRKIVTNSLIQKGTRYYMDFTDLEKKAAKKNTKLLILCSPHNPAARVWEKEELEKLANICLKYNIKIISDEIHADLVFQPHKHIPMANLSRKIRDITITCTSPSKSFNLAGLHISNIIIANPIMRENFLKTIRNLGIHDANIFAIKALIAAYNYGSDWLEQLIVYLNKNYLYLKDYLSEKMPEIKITEQEGTYLTWLDCRSLKINHKKLENILKEEALLAFSQGYIFGKEGSGFIRINIACPKKILSMALKRMVAVFKKHC